MNKFTFEEDNRKMQQLQLLQPKGEKVEQTSVRGNTSFTLKNDLEESTIALATKMRLERGKTFVFTPKNDLEEIAIAIATAGEQGWKGSLYSLDYTDTYREHTCFIFATQPKGSNNQQWLLVSNDTRNDVKYWSALGEMPLKDIYYAWTKIVQKPLSSPADLSLLLNQQIASALYLWESITLKELVDIFPVSRLTEIYLYLKIAYDDPRHEITDQEEIVLIEAEGLISDRQVTMPKIIFHRQKNSSIPPNLSCSVDFSKIVQKLQVERVNLIEKNQG
jgi:hypothetical protein